MSPEYFIQETQHKSYALPPGPDLRLSPRSLPEDQASRRFNSWTRAASSAAGFVESAATSARRAADAEV